MNRRSNEPGGARTTPCERAVVLAGFAAAALCTASSAVTEAGIETVAAAWLAAAVWAFVSSLALALRRGIRRRDWSAFGRYRMTDSTELIDWSTRRAAAGWTWPSRRRTSG